MMLKNKVAIVTGGGSGIGRAIALRLAREGADIVVVDVKEELAEKTAEDTEKSGIRSLALKTDVSISADVDQMVKTAVKKFGRIDILVNNAGIIVRKNLFDHTEEDWDKVLNINLKSVFLCCKQVVPLMMKQGKGKIINIASGAGHIGMRRGVYGASKAGVINLTASMALELAPYKINVNAISPGTVETSMSAAVRASAEMEEKIVKCIPYGRLGRPEDIASAVVFLASEESDYMVGGVVNVDGGLVTTFNCY